MTGMDVGELDIAKYFFAKSEYEYITDCPDDETRRRFYEIWTAKEAYSKYGGKGFGIDFGSFEVVKKENNFYVFVDRTQKHIVNVRDTVYGYMLSFLCEDEGEISVETEYGGKKYVSICGLFRQYFIFIRECYGYKKPVA